MRCLFTIILIAYFSQIAFSQQPETKKFSSKHFSFNYPENWKLTDKSSQNTIQFNLTPPSGNVLIMIKSYDITIDSYYLFKQVQAQTATTMYDKIYDSFSRSDRPQTKDVCTTLNERDVPGIRVRGNYNNEKSTADFFYVVLNKRFYNFVYLRNDKENSKSDVAWNELIKTFSEKKNSNDFDFLIDSGNDTVINARAKELIKPIYPSTIRNITTKVEVDVVIYEDGDVISAKPISGHSYFFKNAENAARRSKFRPAVVCGKPGKTFGLIVYSFEP